MQTGLIVVGIGVGIFLGIMGLTTHSIILSIIGIAIIGVIFYFIYKEPKVDTQTQAYIESLHKQKYDTEYYYNKTGELPKDFVVVDVETTGLYASDCDIIQLSAIKFVDLKKVDQFDTYVNPQVKIPAEITSLTGITDQMVANAPVIKQVLQPFLNFIGNYTLVAHNSDFDMNFIQTQLKHNLGKTLDNRVVDTLSLSRKYVKGLRNYKLGTIKDFFKMELEMHNSLNDCEVTGRLYIYCLEKVLQFENVSAPNPDMTNEEQAYYIKVIKVLKKHNKKLNKVYINKTKTYFDINYKVGNSFARICRFKLSGKCKYLLTEQKVNEVKKMNVGGLVVVPGSQAEHESGRILIESPEDIDFLEQIILKNYAHCRKMESYEKRNHEYIAVE